MLVPRAAFAALRLISEVAAFCCRTEAAALDGPRIDFVHAVFDAVHRLDRAAGRFLHRQNVTRDLLGRLRGLDRERFHFGGDHGEAAPGFAGARRLDGGVERQADWSARRCCG